MPRDESVSEGASNLRSMTQLDFYPYAVDLTTRFRGITRREGLLVHGPAGWGEVSPFLDYDVAYSAQWLAAGVESALFGYPAPKRSRIPVNVTVPAVEADQAFAITQGSGATTAKVKVAEPGQRIDDDKNRVAAVRHALGESGRIRVDVNGRWSVDEAISYIADLDAAAGGLEYVEQPVASVEDLARVRRKVNVPIAADESIRRARDPYRVKELEAADVIVVKNQPLGGVRRALAIVSEIGMPAVVSSALESAVGIRAGLAFAAALDELPYACGLATGALFTADVSDAICARDGFLDIPEEPIVPQSIPHPDAECRARWEERLGDMWEQVTFAYRDHDIIKEDVTFRFHHEEYRDGTID